MKHGLQTTDGIKLRFSQTEEVSRDRTASCLVEYHNESPSFLTSNLVKTLILTKLSRQDYVIATQRHEIMSISV